MNKDPASPTPSPQRPTPDRFWFWSFEKLRNADTDQFHHVNNAAIASFLEGGRMELFSDPSIAPLMSGLNVVVGRLNIEFHAELFYPGELKIGSMVTRIGRSSFDVLQGVFRDGTCVASAVASCVLLQSGKPYPIPDAIRAHLLGNVGDAPNLAGA
ncbi:acyl-CoA thioesterase [Bradyrhizobium tropiciagri]|uniref:acyl-CoA thioesterase n=1 Tax=Bradyrhizobium tropiciagri TaxID=312253 RepID=UPI001BA644AF|nr:thioesterase family protein [Bradyrhizobium tropiciagri]MBR0869405.1 acyl-CoA thioesterase [Bradyrhizobium tropiciagri]